MLGDGTEYLSGIEDEEELLIPLEEVSTARKEAIKYYYEKSPLQKNKVTKRNLIEEKIPSIINNSSVLDEIDEDQLIIQRMKDQLLSYFKEGYSYTALQKNNIPITISHYITKKNQRITLLCISRGQNTKPHVFAFDPEKILGTGGSSIVFKGQELPHSPITDPLVAIKVSLGESHAKTFATEAALLDQMGALRCKVHDEILKYHLVVEDYARGKNLDYILEKEFFDITIAIKLFHMLLSAYRHLHKTSHIYHRDVKPSNIRVQYIKDNNGLIADILSVKIIDFGNACSISEAGKEFNGTKTFNEPDRMLPEYEKLPYTSYHEFFSVGIMGALLFCKKYPKFNYETAIKEYFEKKANIFTDAIDKPMTWDTYQNIFHALYQIPDIRPHLLEQNITEDNTIYIKNIEGTLYYTLKQGLSFVVDKKIDINYVHDKKISFNINLQKYKPQILRAIAKSGDINYDYQDDDNLNMLECSFAEYIYKFIQEVQTKRPTVKETDSIIKNLKNLIKNAFTASSSISSSISSSEQILISTSSRNLTRTKKSGSISSFTSPSFTPLFKRKEEKKIKITNMKNSDSDMSISNMSSTTTTTSSSGNTATPSISETNTPSLQRKPRQLILSHEALLSASSPNFPLTPTSGSRTPTSNKNTENTENDEVDTVFAKTTLW